MATFQDIIGQEQIVEHLKTAVKTDQVNHAYVIQENEAAARNLLPRFLQRHCSAKIKRTEMLVANAIPANRQKVETSPISLG